MIDEWYDRTYRECRTEFHAGILRLIRALIASLRKPKPAPAGEDSCASAPSPSSPSRCR
jgi:hypothetical protein